MNQDALRLLDKHPVCSLTTLLKDGSPHAAAVHFSYSAEPLELYFSTSRTSKKCEALLDGSATKASVALGFSEEEWLTLQLDGEIKSVTDPAELSRIQTIHYAKHPRAAKFKDDPETLFLKFTPTWWRYTDYNTVPETVVSSEG
ncbi:pyridoxamine 5'-phosphate oxidase family protein [Patescibacteria group bacterium]|nr:pyridoxamine 5'-phosphate oxidase family protein [Patescibacteria group bacterium]